MIRQIDLIGCHFYKGLAIGLRGTSKSDNRRCDIQLFNQ